MVVTGGVCVMVIVPAGPGDCVVHAVTDTAAMQMKRRVITFGSIQNQRLQDLINKTLTARIPALMATALPGWTSIKRI